MSNILFIDYDQKTGEISQWGVCNYLVADRLSPVRAELVRTMIEVDQAANFDLTGLCVDTENGQFILKPQPTMDLPDKLDIQVGELHELPLPTGASVLFDDVWQPVDGNKLELLGERAAEYRIELRCAPFKPHVIKVVVHANSSVL